MAVTASKNSEQIDPKRALALEMADDAITLYKRDPIGIWQEIATADPNAEDFSQQISDLRCAASEIAQVIVWVPAELIDRHELALTSHRQVDRRFAAAERIARAEKVEPETIEIALGRPDDAGRTPCLSIAVQTRIEAEAYARKWGFEPLAVTARSPGDGFQGIARFDAAETSRARRLRKGMGALALVGALATTSGLSAAVLWAMMLGEEGPNVVVPELPDLNLTLVASEETTPVVAKADADSEPMIGASDLAETAPARALSFAMPSYGTDWIAQDVNLAVTSYAQPTLKDDRLTLGKPLAGEPIETSVQELPAPKEPPPDWRPSPPAEEAVLPPEAAFAEMASATPAPVPTPIPRPDRKAVVVLDDQPEPSVPKGTEITEPSIGIAEAPVPIARPENAAARFAAAKTVVPRTSRRAGTNTLSVMRAAKRKGLPLDRTSLIGVVNIQSGRQALLRMPNGRIHRISRGDVLEGWKVDLIGQDAVRLERGAESHTLILVTR
ncbi:MAG: hypothetical protein AAGC79_15875 [Pseudomonadota bacterium]